MNSPSNSRSAPRRWSTYAIAVGALAALGGHLGATLVYLSPPNVAKEHFGSTADAYIKPLFYQNWHLFSPNPGISTRKMAIRCGGDNGQWSEWFDPLEGLTAEHYESRMSGVGKLLYLYRAVGDDLRRRTKKKMEACQQQLALDAEAEDRLLAPAELTEHCAPDEVMDEVMQTEEFDLAIRYTQAVCEEYFADDEVSLERLQFKLLEFFPVPYGEREEADEHERRWGKVFEIFFPVIEGEGQ